MTKNNVPENDFARENERRSREYYLSALSELVTGGLTIDTSDGAYLPPEGALCRTAGALLKAVLVASFHSTTESDLGPGSWSGGSDELTPAEAYEATSMIVSLLRCGPKVIEELQTSGDFRGTWERIEHIDDARERQIRFAGEQAVNENDGNGPKGGAS